MGILTLAIASVLAGVAPEHPLIEGCDPMQGAECGQFGGVGGFAHHLFDQAVVPFELVSILLTVAIVGAIAVARGRTPGEVEQARKRAAAKAAAAGGADPALAAEPAATGGE